MYFCIANYRDFELYLQRKLKLCLSLFNISIAIKDTLALFEEERLVKNIEFKVETELAGY